MLTPRTSVILIILITCIVIYLYFFNDVGFFPSRSQFEDSVLDNTPGYAPRPPYPPFRPPPIEDNPPPSPFQLEGSKPDSHRRPGDTAWPEEEEDASRRLWLSRGESVKQAFLHAYRGYEKYAPFPADELLPLSNRGTNNFNGWGVTMVDSLDTMWLMGLEDEFSRATSQAATLDFSMASNNEAPFFETVIRYLGGLLSAYALSNDTILLSRAEDLGKKLLPVFNTPSGLPTYGVNPQTGVKSSRTDVLLAEIASCQMEYKYLAYATGRPEFFTAADKVMDLMARSQSPAHGMWPTHFSNQNGEPNMNSQFAVGALADSAYEYLLKQYLLSGKTEERLAKMYMKAMTGIIDNLILISPTRNLVYVTDAPYGMRPSRKFEHLTCFFPGLLALGADTLPANIMSDRERQLHIWAAEAVGHTCWVMYADQPSGLGPENVVFDTWPSEAGGEQEKWITQVEKWEREGMKGGKPPGIDNADKPFRGKVPPGKKKDYYNSDDRYLLRPETLESMFVLWRTTKDQKWRDHGWEIWDAIDKKTRTGSGYASQNSVSNAKPSPKDEMPSYFLAETIKYAYLLTQDNDPLPESTYVLNTEAHPLPIFTWRDWEREKFGVKS